MFPKINLYGLTISFALLTAYSLTAYRCSKRGLRTDLVWDSLPWVVFSGLIGARLYHVLNFLPFYLQNPILIPQVWRGGLGIYGALIGGLFGSCIYLKLKSQNSNVKARSQISKLEGGEGKSINSQLLSYSTTRSLVYQYLDAAAPGIVLGQAIGRVGNIFNGENLPYAGWEIAANLLIFGTLLVYEFIYNKTQNSNLKDKNQISKIKNEGSLFFLYLLSYSVTRFTLEFFRTDSPWIVGPLTMAQWVSVVIVTVILLLRLRSRVCFHDSNHGSNISTH